MGNNIHLVSPKLLIADPVFKWKNLRGRILRLSLSTHNKPQIWTMYSPVTVTCAWSWCFGDGNLAETGWVLRLGPQSVLFFKQNILTELSEMRQFYAVLFLSSLHDAMKWACDAYSVHQKTQQWRKHFTRTAGIILVQRIAALWKWINQFNPFEMGQSLGWEKRKFEISAEKLPTLKLFKFSSLLFNRRCILTGKKLNESNVQCTSVHVLENGNSLVFVRRFTRANRPCTMSEFYRYLYSSLYGTHCRPTVYM